MTNPNRYEVKASKGNKIIERRFFSDYDDAMDCLDDIELKLGHLYKVEFTDLQLFGKKKGSF